MDISVRLNDDPHNPLNFGPIKKSQEKDLIKKNLAPAFARVEKEQIKQAKKEFKGKIHASSSTVKNSISELDSSMKGKYIKRAKEDINRIAQEMNKIVSEE